MKNSTKSDLLLPQDDEPPSEQSFVDFYTLHIEAFRGFLRSKDVKKGAEDDIIQDTAIVVLKAVRNRKIKTNLRQFTWGVLRITMLNHFRKLSKNTVSKKQSEEEIVSIHSRSKGKAIIVPLDEATLRKAHEIVDEYEDLEILSFNRKRLERVQKSIALLPKADQDLINGKIIRNLSHKELAALLGLSLSNTKVKLHRIKERIKKDILKQEYQKENEHE